MDEQCLFCKIFKGEIPSTEVYSDDDFYAFEDINPAAPTHVLIIPRKHIASVAHATPEDAALLGRLLLTGNEVARKLGVAEDGFRYVLNNGPNAGQTVFHIHLHLLAGHRMTWP